MGVVFGIVGAVAVCLVIAAAVVRGWFNAPCEFCGAKVKWLSQLPKEDQQKILTYFREYEKRKPDRKKILACTNCRTVFDDLWSAAAFVGGAGPQTVCKVCGSAMYGREPDVEWAACRDCKTLYRWRVHETSGFRFFTPVGQLSRTDVQGRGSEPGG